MNLPVLNTLYLTCSFMSNISVKLLDFKWNLLLIFTVDWFCRTFRLITSVRRCGKFVTGRAIWQLRPTIYELAVLNTVFLYLTLVYQYVWKYLFFYYWWFRLSLGHLRGLKHQIVMLWQEQRVSLLLHPCTIISCIIDLTGWRYDDLKNDHIAQH